MRQIVPDGLRADRLSAMSTVSRPTARASSISREGDAKITGAWSGVAWMPNRDLDLPQWISAGRRLGAVGRCSRWWIGDWVRYGTSRWGERYVEAARITGYDPKSLRNLAYVASRFELSRRRDNLSWSHHAELAVLSPYEQDGWLDFVAAHRLSVADLRVELRAALRNPKKERNRAGSVAMYDTVTCPHCGKKVPLPAMANGADGSQSQGSES
jgi:hypothetical protein